MKTKTLAVQFQKLKKDGNIRSANLGSAGVNGSQKCPVCERDSYTIKVGREDAQYFCE